MGLAAVSGLWYRCIGIREVAAKAAARGCRAAELQLLDDTVAFQGLALSRRRGTVVLEWRYRFEYSRDGADRWPGQVRCVGRRAVAIQVEDEQGTTILSS